ncbi:hypothetical protein ACWC5C_12055 [Streptomyces sp. NPDC001700]
MKSYRALAVLAALRSLAAHDAASLAAAKDRLVRAEAELAAARSAFGSASTRAEVSQRVVHGAEELLPAATEDQGADQDAARAHASQGQRPTIAQEVLVFLRPRRRAARSEIVRHLKATRPDIKAGSLRRELNRQVTKGTLLLAGKVYALAPTAGGDT